MAKVLKECKLIIWDEISMAHKKSIEALNQTLKDIHENNTLMGGVLVLFSGDFRQILPVISRSTSADEINACIKSSILWKHVKILTLTTNMRIKMNTSKDSTLFAKQLLDLGEGKIQVNNLTNDIILPEKFCRFTSSLTDLIDKIFPNLNINYKNYEWLHERAILAPRNEEVNQINQIIQTQIPGNIKTYSSIDNVLEEEQIVNYPIEFLNSLEPPGMPLHILNLKIGCIIMLLRNLNPPKLCNGTRLIITNLYENLIEAEIIVGKFKNEKVLIPRIPMISSDYHLISKDYNFRFG